MTLNDYAREFHRISAQGNWWSDGKGPYVIATKIALIHSEVSEVMEAYRRDKTDDHLPNRKAVEVELADVLIRAFDLAGALNLDLEGAIWEKNDYNQRRLDHKLTAREKEGGKKF